MYINFETPKFLITFVSKKRINIINNLKLKNYGEYIMEKKNNCLEKSIHNKEKDQKIDYIARLKEISTPAEED